MRVVFEFDFISPYAYIGWVALNRLLEPTGIGVEPVPILFAALLDAHGHKGPAEIEPKRRYTFKDVVRKAHAHGLTVVPPPGHPFNPLGALRLASLDMEPTTRQAVISALFEAVWKTGDGVTEPEVLRRIADAHGLDVTAIHDPATKKRVRSATEAAIEQGTFGVPTFWVGDELFWGTDSLPHLEAYLRGEDPVPADIVERWVQLKPQARRPASKEA